MLREQVLASATHAATRLHTVHALAVHAFARHVVDDGGLGQLRSRLRGA